MPVQGEALAGFLDRVAAENGQTRGQLYERAQLPPVLAASYAVTANEAGALAAVLGLSRGEVIAMTLAGHRAFGEAELVGARARRGHPWLGLWPDVAAQCPACHAERPGVYPLRSISGVTFACVKHMLLLADRCLGCGNPVRLAATRHGRVSENHVPKPGCCQHSFGARTCGYRLADLPRIDLAEWPRAIEAQRVIDDFFAVPARAGCRGAASGSVLAALARWLLHGSVDVRFVGVPEHLHEFINVGWRGLGGLDARLHLGRRARSCVALVMSVVAPGYLAGDAERLAADLRDLIVDPTVYAGWVEGLPYGDPVVRAAADLVFEGDAGT
jgi:hypothetical protein